MPSPPALSVILLVPSAAVPLGCPSGCPGERRPQPHARRGLGVVWGRRNPQGQPPASLLLGPGSKTPLETSSRSSGKVLGRARLLGFGFRSGPFWEKRPRCLQRWVPGLPPKRPRLARGFFFGGCAGCRAPSPSGAVHHLMGQGDGRAVDEGALLLPALEEEGEQLPFALDVDGPAAHEAEAVLLQDQVGLLHHLRGPQQEAGGTLPRSQPR